MKKKVYPRTIALLVLIVSAVAAAAQSQTSRAQIPFDFVLMGRVFPKGSYTITQAESRVAMLTRDQTPSIRALVYMQYAPRAAASVPRFVFEKESSEMVLTRVSTSFGEADIPKRRLPEKTGRNQIAALQSPGRK